MKNRTPETVSRERQLLALVCKGLDDKKAVDLKVIDVTSLSSITDYIVVAGGLADTHLRALRIEVEKVLDAQGAKIAGMDRNQESGWLVVDAYQIMVHLFTAEARAKYALEQLWRDGREISVASLLGQPEQPEVVPVKPAARKKAAAKAKPAAKKKAATKKPVAKSVAKKPAKKAAAKKPAVKKAAVAKAKKPAAKKKR
jgi:ribosome-associated protein